MNVAAAGMESDFSDSDNEMVFSTPNAPQNSFTNSSTRKTKEPEFVAVPKPTVNSQNNVKTYTGDAEISSESKTSNTRNNFHKQTPKPQNNRPIMQKSLLLDDLRYAIMQGNLDAVKEIIDKGIWIDSILKAGWTPLMYACSFAHHEIVLYLIQKKADPNYHKNMFTPLMAVCSSSKKNEDDLLNCCKHLLDSKADVNAHERYLTTPLMFASKEGHLKVVMELVNSNAKISSCDNRGRTALSWASANGHGIIVRFLLSKGANPKEVDNSGQTCADVARQNGHDEIAAVIERYSEKTEDSPESLLEEQQKSLSKSQENLLKYASTDSSEKPQEKYYSKHNELELFLNGIDLSYLVSLFHDHQLSFEDMLLMNDEQLEQMGIKQMGTRKKIIEATKAAHKKEWKQSSLPDFTRYQYITCPDAVAMMANIAKHLKYVSTTVTYIRTQIQTKPRIIEIAQETANVHDLIDEMNDSLLNVKNLNEELRFFRHYLNKVQDNPEYISGDLIIDTVPVARYNKIKNAATFAIISLVVGGILWKRPSLTTIMSFVKSHFTFSSFSGMKT